MITEERENRMKIMKELHSAFYWTELQLFWLRKAAKLRKTIVARETRDIEVRRNAVTSIRGSHFLR